MSEEGKERGVASGDPHHHHHHHGVPPELQYGTFQGVANYPPQPAIGFPQPVPPPGATANPQYFAHGYQAVPGYAVAEGTPVRERRLRCCGCGMGWVLFIIGFFLAAIPWYVGAFILLCVRSVDYREKPGYIACTIAAVIATVAILFGATKVDW
ncbi:60S ribosomal protein L18a-like protein isoform X2 [Diospyros lotus]|uniref:60S ribosomal protein L18a-like protein isoform X2 n=1 Tax=Diospyros lotus TaxID=55363 RepID=UPI00225A665A|nr:60S ribosomal protein L18a-like protein isoform X2 [Diospyros lotus]